jgi:hypothetical protein
LLFIFSDLTLAGVPEYSSNRAVQAAELDLYSRLSNTQRRLSESLGWERTARDVTPDLETYLKQTYGGQRTDGEGTP